MESSLKRVAGRCWICGWKSFQSFHKSSHLHSGQWSDSFLSTGFIAECGSACRCKKARQVDCLRCRRILECLCVFYFHWLWKSIIACRNNRRVVLLFFARRLNVTCRHFFWLPDIRLQSWNWTWLAFDDGGIFCYWNDQKHCRITRQRPLYCVRNRRLND